MGIVLKTFKCKETGTIFYAGTIYSGDREEELAGLGYVEDESAKVDFDKLKLDEIKAELEKDGIEFDPKAKKDELLELLKSSSK